MRWRDGSDRSAASLSVILWERMGREEPRTNCFNFLGYERQSLQECICKVQNDVRSKVRRDQLRENVGKIPWKSVAGPATF